MKSFRDVLRNVRRGQRRPVDAGAEIKVYPCGARQLARVPALLQALKLAARQMSQVPEAPLKPYPCGKCDGWGIRREKQTEFVKSQGGFFIAIGSNLAWIECSQCEGWGLIFPRRQPARRKA